MSSGCTASLPYPEELDSQIDHKLTLSALKRSPNMHKGKTILIGGVVLSPKSTESGTRLEILQLPLDDDYEPAGDRMSTEGRFLAMNPTFLDPAVIPAGSRVTIVGEVTDSTTLPLDETTYTYPTLLIKHLKIWAPSSSSRSYWRPYFGPYYPWGPYFGPWGPYQYYCRWPYRCW